ncbi:hypothetical protein ZYGR_0AK02830 [Zygosaccharomyces rouxii]|uniref:Uncharacterized protein n=1 Tax=Zygosaccharomyces rouxii TaxID=4956 RepID=A0A1Q3ADN6_ZYGRO|nr:hypothetical protein ZYGR_0AK02830 [Zygosaccharomyces rouxii]
MDSKVPVDLATLQETLEHLHRVINGSAFYLNTVRLKQGEIWQCCESYWCEQLGASTDAPRETYRLQEMASLARLVHKISIPLDSTLLTQINEHLKKIFPSSPVYKSDSGSNLCDPSLDEKLLTSVVVDLLISVCRGLAGTEHHTSLQIQKEIVSTINVKFTRPYSSLLWNCAKQELQT